MEKEEEKDKKWLQEEETVEEEEEYPCVFDRETLSDPLTGKYNAGEFGRHV